MEPSENTNFDFGELNSDNEFKKRALDFQSSLDNTKKLVDEIVANDIYEDLSIEDKIRYDLFLSFTINSLYWLFLRTEGKDPSQHDLKSEINRCKDYMAKSKQLYERKTVMPRIDQAAAKRFVRSGLWDPSQKDKENEEKIETSAVTSSNKRKREDSDGD